MQAVRQCLVCANRAAGGLLRTQMDFSLLHINNRAAFRIGAACSRFLSSSGRRMSGVHKLGEATTTTTPAKALKDTRGLFDIPSIQDQQMESLSYDSMIRRAASLVTDSSSTFLSQTTVAFTDALKDYSKAVHSRIAFQKRYLASLGKLTAMEEDLLLQVINGWRAESSKRRDECKHYEQAWINAVSLSKAAAEIAQSSGAQQASASMMSNLQVSQSQVEEARKVSVDADKKLAETKVEEIQRMAEYTAFLGDGDEHEIHEAYLRED
ncbi:diablo homolog, mitochondrial-like [Gouania willdenowi]|uniref:Direct IAP-binding protein with low pI n=1 Tax=Gouania willdenowi TaxID=441366 RepID=A0A8C5GUH8_GOUWI|nr:diablo homolog, mitochondrial-like [Gouania willdenowi]